MLGIQAAVIVTATPALIVLGVLRMLIGAAEVLLEMGQELAWEIRWLVGLL